MDAAEALLGHGVTVLRTDGGLLVESREIALPWRPGHGRVTGTAVEWDATVFEVAEVRRADGGERWTLRPWPEGEVIRHAARLDAAAIEALAAARADDDRRAERHAALRLALPFVGLMPAEFQRRWEREYNVPGVRATVASGVLELGFSALVPLQAVSEVFHEPLLPAGWRWLAALALVAGVDALVRLAHVRAMREPIGSVFTAPLRLVSRSAVAAPDPVPAPAAVASTDDGILELASPILRLDWEEGGVLELRGREFRCERLASHAAPWIYRFAALDGPAVPDAPRLRLLPAGPARATPAEDRPGAVRTILGEALRMTLFAFAPGALQSEWAAVRRLPVLTPTLATAALEALGGALSLIRERQGDVLLVLVDLLLIGEGLLRAALAAATREPVGSVLGLPWRRHYRRWLDQAGGASDPAGVAAGPSS